MHLLGREMYIYKTKAFKNNTQPHKHHSTKNHSHSAHYTKRII